MNLSLINLFLAFFWVAAAIVLFILNQMGKLGESRIPWEGAALVLALYNLVRWWSMRVAAAQRRQDAEMPRRPSFSRAGDQQSAPDPNFVFTDPPPPASEGGATE